MDGNLNCFLLFPEAKMKVFICLAVIAAVAVAFPQKEGNAYTQEAIKQAQNTLLIPKDAQIQKVIN